jgi:integrase
VEEQKRRSTYCGYQNIWLRYLQPNGDVALRDVRTFEAEQLMKDIARRENLSRTTLGHIKHFLSGTFRYARRQGVLENPNPMHDVEIPKARPAGETYAYSLEEEAQMSAILPEPTATVVATAAFTGARKEEIRGFTWENYDGSEIRVEKSVWRSHVDEPKRPKSKGATPVIAQLKLLLDQHWQRCGRPRKGFIFSFFLADSFSPVNDSLSQDAPRHIVPGSTGWRADVACQTIRGACGRLRGLCVDRPSQGVTRVGYLSARDVRYFTGGALILV